MPKMYEADKVMDSKLKPETKAKKEGILKPLPLVLKSVSCPQRIIPLVPTRKGHGRAGTRRKTTELKSQLKPQLQHRPTPLPTVPSIPEPPITVPPTSVLSLER